MLINTIHGELDDSLLEKTEGTLENDNERTTWVEYRMKGDPAPRVKDGVCLDCAEGICRHVHRSAHVTLKKLPAMQGQMNSFR